MKLKFKNNNPDNRLPGGVQNAQLSEGAEYDVLEVKPNAFVGDQIIIKDDNGKQVQINERHFPEYQSQS